MVQSLKPATFRNQFFPILVDFEAMAGEHMRKNRGIFFVCIEWIYWFTSSSFAHCFCLRKVKSSTAQKIFDRHQDENSLSKNVQIFVLFLFIKSQNHTSRSMKSGKMKIMIN